MISRGVRYEMEEEEQRDEEDRGFDLDDVEKFLNEDDESDMVLEEDEVREVLASALETETIRNLKREIAQRFWTTVKICNKPCNTDAEDQMQSLRQCWTLGTRMSTETCAELQRRWTRWLLSEKKRVFSQEN